MCPFCSYSEIKEPGIQIPPIFRCRRPKCMKLICTMCNQEAHKQGEKCPKLVDEENEESLIRFVQMAIDETWIRYCPSCRTAIVKDKGCNHIRCACGHNFCSQCRKSCEEQDNPSDHFGKPPTFCKQYSDQSKDDEKDMTTAARRAEQEWRRKHPEYRGKPVRIEELTRRTAQRMRN
jgi:LSD1 subclass zinc finger protein